MHTSGLIKLCSKTAFTSTTPVDDIRAYLLEVVDTFCSATGLVLIPSLTKELTYGASYYLGRTAEDQHPLLCVANPGESSSYFYRGFCISCVTASMYPLTTNFSWNAAISTHTYYDNMVITSSDYLLKYLVKDDGTIMFGIGSSTSNIAYKRLIAIISNGADTCTVSTAFNDDSIYFSCCPELGATGNTVSNYMVGSFGGKNSLCNSLPLEKDALLPTYLCSGWKIDNLFKFTNRSAFASGSILRINSSRYVVAYYNSSYLSLLLLLD